MQRTAKISAAVIVLLMTAFGALPAQAAKLTALDYFQIYQLYARYSWSLDSGNGVARTATFTADGTFNSNMSEHKGESAQSLGARTTRTGPKPSRHILLNIQLTPTPEGADGLAYAILINGVSKPGLLSGTPAFYFDKLVKTPDGWRFKSRANWLDNEKQSPYLGQMQPSSILGLSKNQ